MIGISEIILILFLVFLFFGPKKIPEFGRLLGKAVKQIQSISNFNINNIEVEESENTDKDNIENNAKQTKN